MRCTWPGCPVRADWTLDGENPVQCWNSCDKHVTDFALLADKATPGVTIRVMRIQT
jgi:hypothetical protein